MALVELWQDDGLRCGDLADRLGVEPPTVTRTLRRLESCGLVERRADPEDARSLRVYLSVGNSKNPSCVAGSGPSRPYSPA